MSEQAKVEQRAVRRKVEVREAKEPGKAATLVGYAAVFNAESHDIGFREVIQPGAFKRSLEAGTDVLALVEHDRAMIIGRRSNGTLRLEEDQTGLRYEVDVPDTQVGRDILTNVRMGNVAGSSFGFRTQRDRWEFNYDDPSKDKRTLIDVDLYDVGPVAEPAYPDTSVAARSRAEARSRQGARSQGEAKTDQDAPAAKPGEPKPDEPKPETLSPDEALELDIKIEAAH